MFTPHSALATTTTIFQWKRWDSIFICFTPGFAWNWLRGFGFQSSSTNPEGGSESENEVDQPPSSSSKPTWKRRRVISEYPEAEHGRILSLTREISMVERELDKRQSREMAKKREIEPRSGPRLFTLEELKYAEFLQPKVVLSKSLSLILSKTTLETRAPLQPNTTANTNTDPRPTHNCTFGCWTISPSLAAHHNLLFKPLQLQLHIFKF